MSSANNNSGSCCTTNPPTCSCSTPTPRSPFLSSSNDGPLCSSIAEFLYDPANCDPGYWCGCSSSSPDDCYPSNTTSTWFGHYTTFNNVTNTSIVYVGGNADNNGDGFPLSQYDSKCRPGYYCPGMNDPDRCVDFCEPSKQCTTPSTMEDCPKDSFCPIATTTPRKCTGLELCDETGLRRFKTDNASIVIIIILIISVIYLFGQKYRINHAAKKRKEVQLTEKKERISKEKQEEQQMKQQQQQGTPSDDEHDVENMKRCIDNNIGNDTSILQHQRSSSIMTSPEMTIDIECQDLSLTIPRVGTIMRGVSGKLPHGKLTAIMGPSGAGKTTFLTLMSGKIDRTGGTLKVNGEETALTKYRSVIGYVPQDDVMLRDLTVEENVRHSALMRLPVGWSMKKKLARVDEILESLEIDHVRDSIVGDEHRRGVSGGQRKRVNIALEMVTKPSLLCLDEPTSGLDSTSSLTVLQSLKDMANAGANVVTVLHQPKYEIFCLFDQILLLGQGGMTVYYGSASNMTTYFENRGFPLPLMANPADYYMDVLSGLIPHSTDPKFTKDDLFASWMCAEENDNMISPQEAKSRMDSIKAMVESEALAKEQAKKNRSVSKTIGDFCIMTREHVSDICAHLVRDFKKDESHRVSPGAGTQFVLLFQRACLQRIRSPWGSLINMIMLVIAGSILPALIDGDAILYTGIPKSLEISSADGDQLWDAFLRQNVTPLDQYPSLLTSVYFFLLIVSCLSVNIFGSERTVFFRETATGQRVGSYWAAKTLETFIWLPIYSAAFVLSGYGGKAWFLQPFRRYWLFFLAVQTGFYGYGMLSSLLFGAGSAALVSLICGTITIVGFSATLGASNGIDNIFFLFWSTQGLVSEEYNEYEYRFDVERLNDSSDVNSDLGTGEQEVGAGVGLGYDLSAGFDMNVGLCFFTAFIWHLLALWTLKTKDYKKQR